MDTITSTNSLRLRDARLTGLTMKRAASGKRTFNFTASSETPVGRGNVREILSHADGAVRLDRAKRGALPLLFNHNWDDPIGMVSSASVADSRLRVTGAMFDTARAADINAMVDAGLKNVSIGYHVHDGSTNRAGDVYTATDWEPYEVSIVTVPADPSVGIGRALPNAHKPPTMVKAKRTPAPCVIVIGELPEPGSAKHVALHEAAHAVALLRGGILFDKVSIFANHTGIVSGIIDPSSTRGLEAFVVAMLAGAVASNAASPYRHARAVVGGADSDFATALKSIEQLNRDSAFVSRVAQMGITALDHFEERTANFVACNQGRIYMLANELLAANSLSCDAVADLLG